MIQFEKDMGLLLLLFFILLTIFIIPYLLLFKPALERQELSRQSAILQELSGVLTLGDEYEGEGNIFAWWPVYDTERSDGQRFIVHMKAKGYRAPLDIFVILSENKQVIQLIVNNRWELSMYDDMLRNNDFLLLLSRMQNVNAPEIISGATYSAKGIVSALNEAREYVDTMMENVNNL